MATMEELRRTIGDFARGPVTASTPTPAGQVNVRGTPGFKVQLQGAKQTVKAPGFGKMAGTAAGRGALVGAEAATAYNDINSGKLEGMEKVQRVGEGVGRLGGAAAGAMLGAATPIPGGAIVGGTAGYFAPEAVRILANTLTGGDNYELPSEKVQRSSQGAPLAAKPVTPQKDEKLDLPTTVESMPVQAPPVRTYDNIENEVNNMQMLSQGSGQGRTAFGAKPGFQPLDANATAQQLIMSALQDIKGIKNQANADTLGGAVAQKVANKQLETIAGAKAKIADQLNAFANSSIGMRQGEQNLVAGDVNIDQNRQNLIGGKANILGGVQKLNAGALELDRSKQLRDVLQEYSTTQDANRRQELANIALTMQGKEPRLPYEFKEAGDSLTGKLLYRINNRTGQAEVVGGQGQQMQPQAGELRQSPNGQWLRYNEQTQTYEPA